MVEMDCCIDDIASCMELMPPGVQLRPLGSEHIMYPTKEAAE